MGAGGLLDRLVLPVGEGVDEQDVDAAGDQGVRGAVGVLVPGVGGPDLDLGGQAALDGVDLLEELGTGEVAAVEGLGADGNGVDGVGVLIGVLLDGAVIGIEG